jgi:hypothetical protein
VVIIQTIKDWFYNVRDKVCFWRMDKLSESFITASAEAMLQLAAQRFQVRLTPDDQHFLLEKFNDWLMAGGDARIAEMIDRPVRTINVFLSQVEF